MSLPVECLDAIRCLVECVDLFRVDLLQVGRLRFERDAAFREIIVATRQPDLLDD